MKRIGILLVIAAAAAVIVWLYLRPGPSTLTLTGTVDGNDVVVGSQITARVVNLAVQDGQEVHQGELLATLDRGVQAADARAAGAAIQQAQANARQSEAQTVLLAATLPAKLQQAEAQQAQAHSQMLQARAQAAQAAAALDKAQDNYNRTAPLVEKGAASPQDLTNARADLASARAGRAAALAAVTATQRAVAAAQAAVNDARAQQRQLAVQRQQTAALEAASRQAQANSQAAAARLGQTEIYAPVDGVITLRAARQGEVVNPGSPIVTIFQLSDTWIDAYVEESFAPLVQLGQTLQVRLMSGQIIQGPVIYKAVEADFATQRDVSRTKRDIKTVEIRIRVPNPRGELAMGMTAYVLLPIGKP
jgi:multidrug resistance efflux pump